MRIKPAKSQTVSQINLVVIPLIALASFFFVMRVVTKSLEKIDLRKEVTFETAAVNADAPMASTDSPLQLRMRQAPLYPSKSRSLGLFSTSNFIVEERDSISGETYQSIDQNSFQLAADKQISTFSVDVDTGGYSNIRRILNSGKRPPTDSIRTEEIINYFSYQYPEPTNKETPFTVSSELMSTPWNNNSLILQIGLKGFSEPIESLPASNLVFLVDVSGSMQDENKLPLVKESLRILTNHLRPEDRVSLVTYANGTQVILPPISGDEQFQIMLEVNRLSAGGGTSGESGLKLAYEQAKAGFIKNGNNRIVLMTDGDFNLGMNSVEEMIKLVEDKRESGIFLSTVGFGTGNYREDMMEQMADHGNGHYSYIDSVNEARRVFERNLRSNLYAIAKDVKLQVVFNPELVEQYRLIGYENRQLKTEDFTNDKVDAGDIGQGHSVTALYEIIPKKTIVDLLLKGKIKQESKDVFSKMNSQLARVGLRYKTVDKDDSTSIEYPIKLTENYPLTPSDNILLASSAAAFGELLRNSEYLKNNFNYSDLLANLARMQSLEDSDVEELNQLVLIADSLRE